MKRKKPNGKVAAKAAKDPYSFGNLLLERGLISEVDLDRALAFQRDNQDVMLGEALVHMGVIERGTLETMLLRQEALKGGGGLKAVGKLVDLATTRTRETQSEIRTLQAKIVAFTGETS